MENQPIIRPPGLGFEMLVDGTVTAVTGESAAYANIVPGAVFLNAGSKYDPANYIDAYIRQDGETRLIHLWLGAAGRNFGTQPPPKHCPQRFEAFFGSGSKRRKPPRSEIPLSTGIRLEELLLEADAERKPSPEQLRRQREAAWAEVQRLHRAATAAHPDRGGDTAEFQRLWPRYEADGKARLAARPTRRAS
jgi:hypothetical protein